VGIAFIVAFVVMSALITIYCIRRLKATKTNK